MKLNELAQTKPETPVDVTPEQLKAANDLAKAIWGTQFPVEPTITEAEADEFTEM